MGASLSIGQGVVVGQVHQEWTMYGICSWARKKSFKSNGYENIKVHVRIFLLKQSCHIGRQAHNIIVFPYIFCVEKITMEYSCGILLLK